MTKEIDLINNFLVDNSELDAISDRLSQFNIFDVLGISQYEIRHSNTLAWLFEPQGHHGFGTKFFQRFLSRTLHECENELSIKAADVELASFGDLQVFREWKNIDLLLISESSKLAVIIENKIKAKESKGQLAKYFEIVKQEWPDYQIVPIFLTIEGEDPSIQGQDLGYLPVAFSLVLDILDGLQQRFGVSQSDEAKGFVDNYILLLKRLTMQDEELNLLCKKIYRKHRAAIDLIVSYGASSQINEACIEALQEMGISKEQGAVVQETRGMVFFLPKEFVSIIKEVELARWKNLEYQYPFYCWFKRASKGEKLSLVFEIGPVQDYEFRKKLLDIFNSDGLKVRKAAYNEGVYYSRAYSKKVSIVEAGETDDEFNEMKAIAKKMYRDLEKKLVDKKCAVEGVFTSS